LFEIWMLHSEGYHDHIIAISLVLVTMPFSFLGAKHLVSFLSSCLFDLCPYCAFSCGGIPEDTSWYKIARYRQRAFFSVSFVRIGDSWVIQLQLSLPYCYSFVPTPTSCHDCHVPFTPPSSTSHLNLVSHTLNRISSLQNMRHTSFMFKVITSHSDGSS